MYKPFDHLEVYCPTNPDYCGEYSREDIEADMLELIGTTTDWISYVLNYLFDDEHEFTKELDDVICNPNVTTITVRFGDDYVTIRKCR